MVLVMVSFCPRADDRVEEDTFFGGEPSISYSVSRNWHNGGMQGRISSEYYFPVRSQIKNARGS